jgi:hypothetical protein
MVKRKEENGGVEHNFKGSQLNEQIAKGQIISIQQIEILSSPAVISNASPCIFVLRNSKWAALSHLRGLNEESFTTLGIMRLLR